MNNKQQAQQTQKSLGLKDFFTDKELKTNITNSIKNYHEINNKGIKNKLIQSNGQNKNATDYMITTMKAENQEEDMNRLNNAFLSKASANNILLNSLTPPNSYEIIHSYNEENDNYGKKVKNMCGYKVYKDVKFHEFRCDLLFHYDDEFELEQNKKDIFIPLIKDQNSNDYHIGYLSQSNTKHYLDYNGEYQINPIIRYDDKNCTLNYNGHEIMTFINSKIQEFSKNNTLNLNRLVVISNKEEVRISNTLLNNNLIIRIRLIQIRINFSNSVQLIICPTNNNIFRIQINNSLNLNRLTIKKYQKKI